MEENLHKDNLEEFFKTSFEEENIEPSADQWDVPSDTVWTGINEAINPADPSAASVFSLKWLMAVAAGILFLGLVYYNYTLQNQIVDLEEQVVTQNNTIDELKNELLTQNDEKEKLEEGKRKDGLDGGRNKEESDEKSSDESNENLSFEPIRNSGQSDNLSNEGSAIQNNALNNLPELKNKAKKKSTANIQPSNQQIENAEKTKEIAGDNLNIDKSSIGIKNDDFEPFNHQSKNQKSAIQDPIVKNTDPSQSEENAIAILLPLASKRIYAEANNQSEDITLEQLPVPENALDFPISSNSRTGLYVGAHIAPTYGYRNIRSVNGPVLRRLLNEKEQPVYSVALGLKAGYQFSKNWSVETGLNYFKNSVRSLHRAQIRYESQIERLNSDGNYDSNYPLKLSTSYGEIETDVALTRSSSTQIDQNDYINLVVKTQQQLKYLGVPIALRYRTAGNKFHFSAKAGVSGNFIIQKEVRIKAATVNRNGVHHKRTIIDRKFSGLKNTTFDFLFGLGLDCDISKNMSIYFEPILTHSISPVYALNGKIKTYPMVVSLNIGLSHQF